jgi:DNA-binding response OmpR family regulator
MPDGTDADPISVLVVEDDQATYAAMRSLLEHYGFSARHASTASEAMALLGTNPQYVLLDLMLPDGDGSKILEHIRIRQLPIKVAVITGISDPERLRKVQRLGPDAILTKPLDLIALLEKIKPATE